MHLITAPTFTNHGATFKAAGFEQNLYASADAWSAPVAAEVGPDGAVWIADWYNPICNHNPYRKHHNRGKGNGFITADRDREHGRIYRIFPSGSVEPAYPRPGVFHFRWRGAAGTLRFFIFGQQTAAAVVAATAASVAGALS